MFLIPRHSKNPCPSRRPVYQEDRFSNKYECRLVHFNCAFISITKSSIHANTCALSEYFVPSSHSTYLVGHRLIGDSMIEGYIRPFFAELQECRMSVFSLLQDHQMSCSDSKVTLPERLPGDQYVPIKCYGILYAEVWQRSSLET